ncbi:winged helix DNA-binding domain-containing protein [Actinomycetospora sp. NBRC 106378]|uniref:winged helix DNA-binding domain-containing protein n=1 Tax=Actinomycetospora sp. NBRC 106378 TaxID=3032208 RepID=UPI0024A1D75C|nr:winged helix DNA-binding domain-containing protein [Actinomycetospora sp. NBRC 106378]GLZ55412.1 hypothetical protein Acsp07_50290 [Actinomycetospora sp. NBRC 106378]
MVRPRTLSWRRLNRSLLARQLLLERAALGPEQGIERLGGLQTQYAPSAYVGLFSRLADFRRQDLTDALSRRRVVQGWVMRSTIHMVSAGDHAPLCLAVREARRTWFRRTFPDARELDLPRVAAIVEDVLADGPRRQAEIVEVLDAAGLPRSAFTAAQLWTDLVRVPPAGTWEQPRAHVYGLARTWLPRRRPGDLPAAEERLVQRYLRGYGPASPPDVARFAGWTVTATRGVLARMELRPFVDPDGRELVDLPRAPLPDEDVHAPVRLLSNFDALLLLGHAQRAGVVPAEHREKVFHTRMPQSTPVVLVDGRVAGTWQWDAGRVRASLFAAVPASAGTELDAEIARLEAFAAAD